MKTFVLLKIFVDLWNTFSQDFVMNRRKTALKKKKKNYKSFVTL